MDAERKLQIRAGDTRGPVETQLVEVANSATADSQLPGIDHFLVELSLASCNFIELLTCSKTISYDRYLLESVCKTMVI